MDCGWKLSPHATQMRSILCNSGYNVASCPSSVLCSDCKLKSDNCLNKQIALRFRRYTHWIESNFEVILKCDFFAIELNYSEVYESNMLARVISRYYLFITMSMEKNLNLSDPPVFNRVIVVWNRIWKLKSLGNGMIQATASHAGVKSTNRPTRKFPSVFCKVSSPLTVVRSKYVVQHYFMQIWCNVNLLIYGDSPARHLWIKFIVVAVSLTQCAKAEYLARCCRTLQFQFFSESKIFHRNLCRSVCACDDFPFSDDIIFRLLCFVSHLFH